MSDGERAIAIVAVPAPGWCPIVGRKRASVSRVPHVAGASGARIAVPRREVSLAGVEREGDVVEFRASGSTFRSRRRG